MKKIKYKKTILFISFLSLIPISYFLGGYKIIDSYLEKDINDYLKSSIENKYTGAIKEDAKLSDLNQANNKIKFIFDKEKQNKLKNDTKEIRNQIQLQTETLEDSIQFQKEEQPENLKSKNIEENLKQAINIKNTKVKSKIFKSDYTVLDRLDVLNKAKENIKSIEENNNPTIIQYNTTKGYVDSIYWKKEKKELQDKLIIVKNKIDKSEFDKEKSQKDELEKQINSIKTDTFSVSQGSSVIENVGTNKIKAIQEFKNNSIENIYIYIDNKLEYWTKSPEIVNKYTININSDYNKEITSGNIEEDILTKDKEIEKENNLTTDSSSNSKINKEVIKEEIKVKRLNNIYFTDDSDLYKNSKEKIILLSKDDYSKLIIGGTVID